MSKKKQYEVYEKDKLIAICTAEDAAVLLGVGIDTVRHSIAAERNIKKDFWLAEVEGQMSESRKAQMKKALKDWDEIRGVINPYALGLELSPEAEAKRKQEIMEVLLDYDWERLRKRINPHAAG